MSAFPVLTPKRGKHLFGSVLLAGLICFSASSTGAPPPKPQAADWVDPQFTQPYVDVDEWRDTPVRHRYVHGGFKGTDTLFSIYFPPKEQYEGRFFQPVPAMPGSEHTAQQRSARTIIDITQESSTIGFAIASGAYLVESNQGSKTKYPAEDRTLTGYRASAAVAQYSRQLAAKMYGPHRPYGYAYGGSGGGYKTISFAESTIGIWDGVVPYVIATCMHMPSSQALQAHAVRILKGKFAGIIDALDPGGSGDMYAGLDEEEQAALLEVTRMGFPPRAWFAHERLGYNSLGGFIDELVELDPQYFEDFWKVPGYLGADPPESLLNARIQASSRITRVILSDELQKIISADGLAEKGFRVTSAAVGGNVVPAAFELASMPRGDLKGTTIFFKTGAAAGQKVSVSQVIGNLVTIDIGRAAFPHVGKIRPGDEIRLDNSIYLAAQTLHRHQVPPSREFYVWDQFRDADGRPIYPQRPLQGPYWNERAAGSVQSGKFHGKMIVVETLMDEGAHPWSADWYRSKAKEALGARLDDHFRVWFIDNAMHGAPPPGPENMRIVSYTSALHQALRDLSAWVEKGIAPPTSTSYTVDDGQIKVPASAAERKGIQPVVHLTVNGGKRVDVKAGQPVTFEAIVEVPPQTGSIVRAEWDFEGVGAYPVKGEIKPADATDARATVQATHTFSRPGTYFVALRAAAQRQPDNTPYAQVLNLDRVRVVVK